jgi:hypothetical protein
MSETAEQFTFDTLDERTRNQLVGAAEVDIGSWRSRQLAGAGLGSMVYRVSGEVQVDTTSESWSLVIKTFAQTEGDTSADPSAWNYWKREWMAYQASWLPNDGALVAPRCLGFGDRPETGTWVALEDLGTLDDQRPWSLARFGQVAGHLGEFQAPYLKGQALPTAAWLSAGWDAGWTDSAAEAVARLPIVIDHPLVRRVFSDAMVNELQRLSQERRTVLSALAALPQTLCHFDTFPRNLFVRATDHGVHTVVIDWSYCGPGAVGEDLGGLVGLSLFWCEADPLKASELEAVCLDGFLAGLRRGGWQGEPRDVRLASLGRESLMVLGGVEPVIRLTMNETLHPWVEAMSGVPMERFVGNLTAMFAFEEQNIKRLWRMITPE